MNTRESDFWNERSGPRIAPEHFGNIVATAADIAIVLSERGTVVSVTTNPLNSALGRMSHWEGRRITEFTAPDSERKVTDQIRAVLDGNRDRPDAIEVNHVDGTPWDFPIRYTLHQTGRDGRVLMLGRDLRPVAELQQRLVRAQLALEKDYEAQRVYETRYRVLLEASREALALVDVATGRVLDLNAAAAGLLGGGQQGLVGTAFAAEFEGRRRDEFVADLTRAAQDGAAPVTAPLRRSAASVAIAPTLFRNAGERVLLCRLTDPDAAGPAPARAGALGDRLAALYRAARDGIVFTDADERIVHANDAFLSMMDVGALADLRGRSLAECLARGGVDLKVLTDDAHPAVCATRLITGYGSQLPVEISAAALTDRFGESGHGYVLRETGRGGAMREDPTALGLGGGASEGSALASAMAQVGSASLRDIVASMTDVIEKQCIETAVELTGNNRVAAAEMLGLSRQSLYVKLRKYNLLQRDES